MTTKMRSLRNFRNPIGCLILLAAFAAAGCSTANTTDDVVVNHVDASGNSVPGWVTPTGGSHAKSATMNYIANGGTSSCTECHGSDLAGGISKVSCFGNPAGCHHDPVAPWFATSPATQNHGVSAKKAPGNSGFASCQICHGKNFSGGGSQVSCFTCHAVSAPHSPKPWRGSPYTHATADTANAPVCYQCHAYTGTANPNNPHVPSSPAPAGTAPGCYNGTMCHNQAGHPAGWAATAPAAQPHGDTAKKDGTVAGQGFPSCQTCHGADFAGGTSNVPCFTCHGVNAPHAPGPWRSSAGSVYTHTSTIEAGNAPVCAQCHYPGSPNNPANHPANPAAAGTPPGCFNSTLCHGPTFHPTGWNQAAQHGPVAMQAPSASAGFAYCQICHGTGTTPPANFGGGTTGISCYTCHGVSAPHAGGWQGNHQATDPGNAAVCAQCHQSSAGTPDCFNNTLCHGN